MELRCSYLRFAVLKYGLLFEVSEVGGALATALTSGGSLLLVVNVVFIFVLLDVLFYVADLELVRCDEELRGQGSAGLVRLETLCVRFVLRQLLYCDLGWHRLKSLHFEWRCVI